MINASEIGQYRYCSASWFLQRCGFKPKSEALDAGEKKHVKLGRTIDSVEKRSNHSIMLKIFGYFLLFLGFLMFVFEVVL